MRFGKEELLAVVQRRDERIVPVLERDVERPGGTADALRSDDGERDVTRKPDQTDGLRDADGVAQPLQRELRGVRDFAAADEALEETDTRRQLLRLVA